MSSFVSLFCCLLFLYKTTHQSTLMIYPNKYLLLDKWNDYWSWALALKLWVKKQGFIGDRCIIEGEHLFQDRICLSIFSFKGNLMGEK